MEEKGLRAIDVERFLHSNVKVISFVFVYILLSTAGFYYAHGLVSAPVCNCTLPLTWIVALMSTTGVIVGMAVYIYMKKSIIPESISPEEVRETIRFLPGDQRKIVEALIERGGEISQSELPDETGLSKVKVSRKLKDLERQKIIHREENGMTNKVVLEEKFEDILL
ncbi:MAG: winged helix-turn-helix transcriptional regulator [Candidatus Nanohaloarchaea archaeon]